MKSIKKYMVLMAVPAMLMASCTKKFEDINTDKNQASAQAYPAIYSLTRAQMEYTGNSDFSYDTWRSNILYFSTMMQQFASTAPNNAGDKYQRNDDYTSCLFTYGYQSQVKYIEDLLSNAKKNPLLTNLYQAGRIMRVIIYQRLTDVYGTVPYSQAGQGYIAGIGAPKYDSQESIYKDMLKELDEAATALGKTSDPIGGGDVIYGKLSAATQIALWKKLAYSQMVRLAMRLTKVDAATAKTYVEKAAAGGTFASTDETAKVIHTASGARITVNRSSNVLAGEGKLISGEAAFLSKTFVDYLTANNDPRLNVMARTLSGDNTPANQLGMPNGYDRNKGATDISTAANWPGDIKKYSVLQDGFVKLDAPTYIVTYAQTELLLAEAAQRGWNVGGSAAQHYNNGVSGAMKQLADYDAGTTTIAQGTISAYLTAHPYDAAKGLEQINTQYWAASLLDWYEVFSNWRRSGFPTLTPVKYTTDNNGGVIPRRMLYPATEGSNNAKNFQDALTAQGDNVFNTRVWWDKQ